MPRNILPIVYKHAALVDSAFTLCLRLYNKVICVKHMHILKQWLQCVFKNMVYVWVRQTDMTIWGMLCQKRELMAWWRHQLETFPRYWPFVRGIHRTRWIPTHKGQWHGGLIFSLICAWINSWVNNREAGDLRCHRAHYDVIVMAGASNCMQQYLWDVITYHWPSLDTCVWQNIPLIWRAYNTVYKVRTLFCLLLC